MSEVDFSTLLRRMDIAERNQTDLAKSVSMIVEDQREMKDVLAEMQTDKAVRAVVDKNLDDRLKRIETSVAGIYKLGLWVLAAFASSFIALIVNFTFRGGFFVS